ncbi:MAG: hypothetical protein ACWA6V_12095, partial [Cellvibrio sp.]
MATKKTSRTTETLEQDDLITLDSPPDAEVINLLTPAPSNGYMYFTERDLNKILFNLDTLRSSVYPHLANVQDAEDFKQPQFPSVCLIGLGRCGSNIALDVASLVYNARNFYLNEFNSEEKETREQDKPMRWIKRSLHLKGGHQLKPVFLIEPLV